MEKLILENLEKAGWHLKPSTVGNVIGDIEEEDEDAARMSEREFERRVRAELLDTDLSTTGARYLPDAQSLLNLRTLQTPCVLQVLLLTLCSNSRCFDFAIRFCIAPEGLVIRVQGFRV